MVFHKEKHLKTITFYQDLNINIDNLASTSIKYEEYFFILGSQYQY